MLDYAHNKIKHVNTIIVSIDVSNRVLNGKRSNVKNMELTNLL